MAPARSALSLLLAAGVWLPSAHLVMRPAQGAVRAPDDRVAPLAEDLLRHQLALWRNRTAHRGEAERTRAGCEEWDFMGRTFLVLSLANVAMREPARAPALIPVMDAVIDDTLATERAQGMGHFLMAYGRRGGWVQQPARSLFIDGEVALMLGARSAVRDDGRYAAEHEARVRTLLARMTAAPLHSAESYPDECWTFCNTLALAAIRVWDARSGEDHGALLRAWVATARARLTDRATGMLISSYTLDGARGDGPEGSSIFLAAHMLQLVDPALARDQFARARRHLGRSLWGFGWAREWPDGARRANADVDSGPTVPLLQANAGASGMAILGAAAFGDEAWLRALLASVNLAAFPVRDASGTHLAAGNSVGDAVLLYALTQGPLWRAVGASR